MAFGHCGIPTAVRSWRTVHRANVPFGNLSSLEDLRVLCSRRGSLTGDQGPRLCVLALSRSVRESPKEYADIFGVPATSLRCCVSALSAEWKLQLRGPNKPQSEVVPKLELSAHVRKRIQSPVLCAPTAVAGRGCCHSWPTPPSIFPPQTSRLWRGSWLLRSTTAFVEVGDSRCSPGLRMLV